MRQPFEYALLRVVPRVERGETINAGVVVHCRARNYLGALVHLDADRLRALDPTADAAHVRAALDAVPAACARADTPNETAAVFRWLTAPRSTIVQAGPVHTGLTGDPAAETERLLRLLVLPIDPLPPRNGRDSP